MRLGPMRLALFLACAVAVLGQAPEPSECEPACVREFGNCETYGPGTAMCTNEVRSRSTLSEHLRVGLLYTPACMARSGARTVPSLRLPSCLFRSATCR